MLLGFFLRLGLVAIAVDRPQVVVIIGPAVSQGHDVVNLMRFADAAEPGAVITQTEVLISLQDSLTLAPPRATATARPLTCRPGLGLFGSQIGMAIAVPIGVSVQCSAALHPAWSLRPQRHGAPLK